MKIYLIRHGQSTSDIEDRYGGSYDDHLTDEGKIQAEALAQKLSDSSLDTLYYSPLMRAKETALILQKKLQCQLECLDALRERNTYGILTGMSKKEAIKAYPELVGLLENVRNTINGAEEYDSFIERIMAAFTSLANTQVDSFGIVTHGGPMKGIFKELFFKEILRISDCGYIIVEKNGTAISFVNSNGVEFE